MFRCLQLGKNGLGSTAPNPMVGAVIVCDNKIIGEGFTSKYGGPHAEVNAINSVKDKTLLCNSTIYVSLEPCSHYGKTPPCADLVIKHKIPNVIIGLLDPHVKVAGKGIQKLKYAGCHVITGVLEKECREHHKRFLTFQEKKRPYIILKWAQTADGFMAPENDKRNKKPEPYWITNKKSRQLVHKWRSEEYAILIGTNTAIEDNPKLNVREWVGKSPLRVVIDRNLKIPKTSAIFDKSVATIFITEKEEQPSLNISYKTIDFNLNLAQEICTILYQENCTSVIVEGGLQTLQTFIDSNLWDEARVFVGNTNFNNGIPAPKLTNSPKQTTTILTDKLKIYTND